MNKFTFGSKLAKSKNVSRAYRLYLILWRSAHNLEQLAQLYITLCWWWVVHKILVQQFWKVVESAMSWPFVTKTPLEIWAEFYFLGLELRLECLLHLELDVMFLLIGIWVLVLHMDEIIGGHLMTELALVTFLAVSMVLQKFTNWEFLFIIYV